MKKKGKSISGQGRDALDATKVLSPEQFARLLGYYRSGRGGDYDAAGDALLAHDAAVRKAAREMGDVYGEATVINPGGKYGDGRVVLYHNGENRLLNKLKPGDRVRVVRVAEDGP